MSRGALLPTIHNPNNLPVTVPGDCEPIPIPLSTEGTGQIFEIGKPVGLGARDKEQFFVIFWWLPIEWRKPTMVMSGDESFQTLY